MNNLYEKNELAFSLVWIGVYVILFSLADGLSDRIGVFKVLTAPVGLSMTAVLLIWIGKNGLSREYGLCSAIFPRRQYLCFLPLILLVSVNLWGGFHPNATGAEAVLHTISMLCVGVIEEIIFRGFLFHAMSRDNVKTAVLVSSITFGIGHIVNLLNGAALLPTLLQTAYAAAIGFLFTIIFLRSGSLIPCIMAHCGINALSIFAAKNSMITDIAAPIALIIVPIGYALWILKYQPESR